jgi:hypothetical protein
MPIKVAVEYVMQACEALAAAHAAGVVHRDIKPENLFLTHHAQGLDFIKILDFGISKVALAQGKGKRAHVRTQMPLGSPVYMSPEQIRSSEQVDARTDIWSLGCVLFELLTGQLAFNEPSLMQLSAAILEHEPVPLREFLPDAPIELENVILRCLAKDVNERYGNIAELAIALYPFAPRRSRISAERCYHALKSAGIACPEFDFVSEYPPGIGDAPMLTSTQPVSGVVTLTKQNLSAAALPQLRVPTPTLAADEFVELRPSKRYKLAAFAAVGLVLAAGAYFAVQTRASEPAPKSAVAPSAVTTLAAAMPAPLVPAATANAEPPSTQSSPNAAAPAASAVAPTQATHAALPAPHRAPAAAAKGAASARRHTGESDEPDVGY